MIFALLIAFVVGIMAGIFISVYIVYRSQREKGDVDEVSRCEYCGATSEKKHRVGCPLYEAPKPRYVCAECFNPISRGELATRIGKGRYLCEECRIEATFYVPEEEED